MLLLAIRALNRVILTLRPARPELIRGSLGGRRGRDGRLELLFGNDLHQERLEALPAGR